MRETLASPSPVFQLIRKSPQETERLFWWLVGSLTDLLRLISPDTPEQNVKTAEAFADDLIDTRPDWKPEDMVLFCRFVRRSPPVNTKTLNIMQLGNFLKLYEAERAQERETIHTERKAQAAADLTTWSPEAKQELQKIVDKLEASRPAPELPKLRPNQDPVAQKINSYMREHEKHRNAEGFMLYKGKQMSQQDYVNTRYGEDLEKNEPKA